MVYDESPFLSCITYGFIVITIENKCPIKYFMFDWSIYRLFVLNRVWKREYLHIMIFEFCFLHMRQSLNKNAFWNLIKRNDVNGVSFFHLTYLISLMVYQFSQRTPNVLIKYFMFDWSIYRLFVLNRGWKRDSIHIMIFQFVSSKWSKVKLKTCFETWITRNNVNGVSLFHLSYLITLMVYQCSQTTSNVQIKYFMFDWSINRLFVIDRSWKRDSLQIMLFVHVCSTWDIFELRTRFETWITWNDVNGVR
jgi:hypothetical protein